jgi:hypothetical protein
MFYKFTMNTELANTEPIAPKGNTGLGSCECTVNWSMHNPALCAFMFKDLVLYILYIYIYIFIYFVDSPALIPQW